MTTTTTQSSKIPTSIPEVLDLVRDKLELVKPIWRAGLPLGTAFIAAILVDNMISSVWFLNEIAYLCAQDEAVHLDTHNSTGLTMITLLLRLMTSYGLWPIVFCRIESLLLVLWLIVATALDFLRHGNLEMILSGVGSFSIYMVILMPVIRIAIALNTIETAAALLKLEEHVVDNTSSSDNEEQPSSIAPNIDPIGCNYIEMKNFYFDKKPFWGFLVFLTVDWVTCIVTLPLIKMASSGFGGFLFILLSALLDVSAILISKYEQYRAFMKVWRILAAILHGLSLVLVGSIIISAFTIGSASEITNCIIFSVFYAFRIFTWIFSFRCENQQEIRITAQNPSSSHTTNSAHMSSHNKCYC